MPCANEPVTALARPKETRTEMDIEMNRAELLTPDFAAGEESLEVRLFDEADIPWSELAFRTVSRTLECFFADRPGNLYPVRSEAVAPLAGLTKPHQ